MTPDKNLQQNSKEEQNAYPTTFETDPYWLENSDTKGVKGTEKSRERKHTKLTPTVAINDEFIEHQKRVLEQKKKQGKSRTAKRRWIQYTESKVKQTNKKLQLKQWKKIKNQ